MVWKSTTTGSGRSGVKRRLSNRKSAWTTVRGKRVRVLAAGPGSEIDGGLGEADDVGEAVALEPGQLRQVAVGCGQGTRLVLAEVQPEGKRPMEASAWLNGVQPTPQDRLGG